MAKVRIELDIDQAIKLPAGPIINAERVTFEMLLEASLRRIIRDGCVHFDHFQPNKETLEAMQECETGNLKSFATFEELVADAVAED
jgi:DNA-damage-inducible protein J